MEIALALGGGGMRGIAHLGVIKTLQDAGFEIRAIAGTSIGGLIGGVLAAGYKPETVVEIVRELNTPATYRRKPTDGPSLLGVSGLVDKLSDLLDDKQFDELSIPFACTAVDLNSQKEVYLRRGNLLDAVLATSAFPGVLPPRQIGNALLVDGGVLDPVPVHLARTIAPNLPVLAIALQPSPEAWGTTPEANILDASPIPLPKGLLDNFNKLRLGQAMRIFSQSIEISTRMVAELRLAIDKPEYIIRPDVVRYAMFEMVNPDDLVEIGIKAAEEALDDLLKAQTLTGKVKHFIRTITPSEEPPILGPDPVLQEPME